MKTKHTPGPWFISGSMTRYVEARIDGGLIQEVAACGPTSADNGYGQQQESNARLISAAPELLEALEEVMDEISGRIELDSRTRLRVRDAIRKALGEEK